MHTRTAAAVVVAVSVVGLLGCPKKDDDAPPPPATVAAPPPPTTAVVAPEVPKLPEPNAAGIVARVKAELDNRPDGIVGTPVAAVGATASVQAPAGWTATKGDVTVEAAADKQSQIGVTGGGSAKLPAALAAMGLTNCNWGAPESVTVGKTKLASSAADGMCTHGATQVRTAWVSPSAEQLLVVGAWEQANDGNAVFGSMRSISKATGGGDPGIAACCSALRQNAKSAPPEQQGALIMAAGACDALKNDPNGRAALAGIRGMLAGANVPSTCR